MAIVQISRIQQRRGLQQDLPQLASAEFGWSLDTRRLFIGNGTTDEGAPTTGITEILTQYSNILSVVQSYTYQGTAGGYTVQTGASALGPILRSLQSKIDDIISTRDFGTTGTGVSDDTAALQRAIMQIYSSSLNPSSPQVRRIIRIPAGTYNISSAIVVPPNCTLIGEGKNNTIIVQTANTVPVMTTGDSLFQTGASLGTNSATLPSNISIEKLALKQKYSDSDVFVVDSARSVKLNSVSLTGANVWANSSSTSSAIKILATLANTQQIQIEDSSLTGCAMGANVYTTGAYNIQSIDFNNSYFNALYRGISAGALSSGTPSSINVYSNLFDNVSQQAIVGASTVTGIHAFSNRYRNVGNGTNNNYGSDATPTSSIITFNAPDCNSIAGTFDRSDASAVIQARVTNAGLGSYSLLPHAGVQLGVYQFGPGTKLTLADNQSSAANIAVLSSSISGTINKGVIDYTVSRGTNGRQGRIEFYTNGSTVSYDDEYSEVGTTGITLQIASGALQYTTTATGTVPVISYTIRWLT